MSDNGIRSEDSTKDHSAPPRLPPSRTRVTAKVYKNEPIFPLVGGSLVTWRKPGVTRTQTPVGLALNLENLSPNINSSMSILSPPRSFDALAAKTEANEFNDDR